MRIVTLLPSATDIVAALGAAEHIVGISHECEAPEPPASGADRPRLTRTTLPDELGTRAIDARVVRAMVAGEPLYVVDAEKLEALEPDLVITQALCTVCAVTPTMIGLLGSVTQRDVLSLSGHDFASVLADIRAVGRATGRDEAARELSGELEERWAALSAPDPEGPTVLVAEWPDPLWVGGHWMPELVTQAGGVDPFGRAGEPSRRSSWKEALSLEPDVVVFAACSYDVTANRESARGIPTGGARRYAIDARRLTSRGGPQLVEGLRVMRAIVDDDPGEIDKHSLIALPTVD